MRPLNSCCGAYHDKAGNLAGEDVSKCHQMSVNVIECHLVGVLRCRLSKLSICLMPVCTVCRPVFFRGQHGSCKEKIGRYSSV